MSTSDLTQIRMEPEEKQAFQDAADVLPREIRLREVLVACESSQRMEALRFHEHGVFL